MRAFFNEFGKLIIALVIMSSILVILFNVRDADGNKGVFSIIGAETEKHDIIDKKEQTNEKLNHYINIAEENIIMENTELKVSTDENPIVYSVYSLFSIDGQQIALNADLQPQNPSSQPYYIKAIQLHKISEDTTENILYDHYMEEARCLSFNEPGLYSIQIKVVDKNKKSFLKWFNFSVTP